MPSLDGPAPGTVIWVDLQTRDLAAARRFYGELFAWSFDAVPGGGYLFARVGGPMEVTDQGRMAYFAAPTEALFGVWQARAHRGGGAVVCGRLPGT